MLRSTASIVRAHAPSTGRTLSLVPLARALPSPSSAAPRSLALLGTATTTTTVRFASSSTESTNLRASAGSGRGGKAEKQAAKAAKLERERLRKERAKDRAQKEKDKAQRDKERAKDKRDKERAKAAADKLKEKERKLKLKEKKASAVKVKKPRTTSALHPPKAPQNAWGIFLTDFIADKKRSLADGEKLASVSLLVKDATPLYQALSSEDKAALHERSEEQRRAYPDILAAWKATLTPDMIKEENAVRTRRRKLGLSRKANLRVEGQPKKAVTAFLRFATDVRARGVDSDVLQGETSILEQSKLIAQAWRALSDDEKKAYVDAYTADKERYLTEKAAFDAEQAKKVDSPSA
ncbi:hypothetical protein JCM8208_006495 [Rhodotorula glutinis]